MTNAAHSDQPMSRFTVRLPENLCRASRELAARRGVSLNALVRESLSAAIEEDERRYCESFTLLGQDAEESDVEHAIPAQREVVVDGVV